MTTLTYTLAAQTDLPFLKRFCLIDSETADWSATNEDGTLDPSRRTPDAEWTRLVQYAVNGKNPKVVDLLKEPLPEELIALAKDYDTVFVAHNAGYDQPRLAKLGLNPQRWFDTMVASQIQYTGIVDYRHNLYDVIARETGLLPYDDIGKERIAAEGATLYDRIPAWREAEKLWLAERKAFAEAAYRAHLQEIADLGGNSDSEASQKKAEKAAVAAGKQFDAEHQRPVAPEGLQDEIMIPGWIDGQRRANKSRLQMSNWASPELTEEQLIYAATDVGPEYDAAFRSLWKKSMHIDFKTVVETEMNVLPIVWRMSRQGLKFNLYKWRELIKEAAANLIVVEDRIRHFCDWKVQELFPERFMITLKRKKPREEVVERWSKGKPEKRNRAGVVTQEAEPPALLRAGAAAQTKGDLAAIQPHPDLTPWYGVHPKVAALENVAADYRVGYVIREELGLKHKSRFKITSDTHMRPLVNTILSKYGIDFTVPEDSEKWRMKDKEELAQENLTKFGVPFTWEHGNFDEQCLTEILMPLAAKFDQELHELLKDHLEAQGLRKLVGTYGAKFWAWADKGGYIRASFKTCEADTHRIQTVDPSLLNIPRDFQKKLWCCEEDEAIIKADFQSQEGVLLMYLGNQMDVYQKILEGLDLHSMSAHLKSNIPYDDLVNKTPGKKDKVKPEHDGLRTDSKPVTFAPCYGCGEGKVAYLLKCSKDAGKRFLDRYWQTYDRVKLMQDQQERMAADLGYVTNLSTGRRRFFRVTQKEQEKIKFRETTLDRVRRNWRNPALNFACQSSGAAILRECLLGYDAYSQTAECAHIGLVLRLTIHDALLATCKKEYAVEGGEVIRRIMEEAATRAVPGIKIGVDVDILYKHAPRTFEFPEDDAVPELVDEDAAEAAAAALADAQTEEETAA